MNKEEIFKLMNENPVFYLATTEDDQPKVRGMLLYRADENGIIFHTSSAKDIYSQIMKNPKVEMCFFSNGVQIRVAGVLERITNPDICNEVYEHPTRKFLQMWKENGIDVDGILEVFSLKKGTAVIWTMESNFVPKKSVQL